MLRNLVCASLLAMALLQPASASEAALQNVPDARVVGDGILTYTFLDVYKATLYAPSGQWSFQKPFALSIRYLRSLNGAAIADRSVQEMRAQGFKNEVLLATWHSQMKAIFPNVQNGTVLSGVYIPGQETVFYRDNTKIGAIKGDAFGQRFFGIWLNANTSQPALRQQLLGNK